MTTSDYLTLRDPTTRRNFFRLAGVTGVAGSAMFVAACGGDDDKETTTAAEGGEGDVTILNAALDLEHTAVAAYTAGAPLLEGAALAAAGQFLDQEKEHAAALTSAIKELGGTPNKAKSEAEYRQGFPRLRDRNDVLRFAVDLENTAVAAYVGAAPKLTTTELRQTAAAINANEAEHISVLLGALGEQQVPRAFVTGGGP